MALKLCIIPILFIANNDEPENIIVDMGNAVDMHIICPDTKWWWDDPVGLVENF